MNVKGTVELYRRRDEESIRASSSQYGGYCRRIAENIPSGRQDVDECLPVV